MKKLLIKSRLIFILTLSILLSCRTTKQSVSQSIDATSTISQLSDSVVTTTHDEHQSVYRAADSIVSESSTVETVDVYLSAPDSTGVQYPTRITHSSTAALRTLAWVKQELKKFDLREHYQVQQKDSTTKSTVLSASLKETKSKKPPSVSPLIILICIALVYVCIRYWSIVTAFFKRIISLLKL